MEEVGNWNKKAFDLRLFFTFHLFLLQFTFSRFFHCHLSPFSHSIKKKKTCTVDCGPWTMDLESGIDQLKSGTNSKTWEEYFLGAFFHCCFLTLVFSFISFLFYFYFILFELPLRGCLISILISNLTFLREKRSSQLQISPVSAFVCVPSIPALPQNK